MKYKIKQVIIHKTTVYLFTENPQEDIKEFVSAYENRDDGQSEIELGYEIPILSEYTFLGNKHKCILLWFDNEDVPDFFINLSDNPILIQ